MTERPPEPPRDIDQVGPACERCLAGTCEAHCGGDKRQEPDPERGREGPCTRPAGWGTGHVGVGRCKLHGGCSPTHETKGRRLLAQKALAVHLRDLVYEPLGDPVVELADVAAKWRTLADWAIAQAAELETADAGPMLELAIELGKQANRALTDCGRLGLEERRVRLEEAQLDLAAAVIAGVLRRAGIDPDGVDAQGWLEATYAELGS